MVTVSVQQPAEILMPEAFHEGFFSELDFFSALLSCKPAPWTLYPEIGNFWAVFQDASQRLAWKASPVYAAHLGKSRRMISLGC